MEGPQPKLLEHTHLDLLTVLTFKEFLSRQKNMGGLSFGTWHSQRVMAFAALYSARSTSFHL
jgi:hypothetical protein